MSQFFEHFPIPVIIFFVLLFGTIIGIFGYLFVQIIKARRKLKQCKALPMQNERARVIAKRMDVSGGKYTDTDYYVTFELDSGERVEFEVDGKQYGLLTEGDDGILSHQDILFDSFTRS